MACRIGSHASYNYLLVLPIYFTLAVDFTMNAVFAATYKCLLALKRIKMEGAQRKRKVKEKFLLYLRRKATRVEESACGSTDLCV